MQATTPATHTDLTDQSSATAIVTGASRGLGREIARLLYGRGYRLALVARDDSALQATAAEFRATQKRLLTVAGDITVAADRRRVLEVTLNTFGRVDVLVNNAGVAPVARYAEQSVSDLTGAIGTNLAAPAELIRLVLPVMLEAHHGRILNISSTFALAGSPYTVTYSAAKAGLGALTRSLASELKGTGVKATVAYPRPIRGDSMLARMQEASGVDLPWMPAYRPDKVALRAVRAMERGKTEVVIAPGGRLATTSKSFSEWVTRRLGVVAGMEAIAEANSRKTPTMKGDDRAMTTEKNRTHAQAGSNYRFDDLTTSMILDDLRFQRDDPGPGNKVPEFDLPTTDGGRFTSDYLGDRPVLMVFGSRTCPITESSGPHLKNLHHRYGSSIRFVMVNTREAHPGEIITQPKTSTKKHQHAVALRDHHGFDFEVAEDDIEGFLHRAMSPKPNSAYLIDPKGTILYRAHWANDHHSLEPILQQIVETGSLEEGKSRGMLRPMLMAVGHLPGIIDDAGRKTGRDVWRAAPPLAFLAQLSQLFPNVDTDRRGGMALLMAVSVILLAGLGVIAAL